ncbi:MAG TPA: hypothetical protein PK999_16640 [Nitrospira sp.]|nr:hypothetical protein [Nitrospira sp.]
MSQNQKTDLAVLGTALEILIGQEQASAVEALSGAFDWLQTEEVTKLVSREAQLYSRKETLFGFHKIVTKAVAEAKAAKHLAEKSLVKNRGVLAKAKEDMLSAFLSSEHGKNLVRAARLTNSEARFEMTLDAQVDMQVSKNYADVVAEIQSAEADYERASHAFSLYQKQAEQSFRLAMRTKAAWEALREMGEKQSPK